MAHRKVHHVSHRIIFLKYSAANSVPFLLLFLLLFLLIYTFLLLYGCMAAKYVYSSFPVTSMYLPAIQIFLKYSTAAGQISKDELLLYCLGDRSPGR
jgi:hypothetical protein